MIMRAENFDTILRSLYGNAPGVVEAQQLRYGELLSAFRSKYGAGRDVVLYSVPGRTELCGNHTDHNNGIVMAAAVNLDIIAAVSPSGRDEIRISSSGYEDEFIVPLSKLEPNEREHFSSTSIVRGVAAGIAKRGHCVRGFDAYIASDVLKGSGLSSSAAFEICIAAILNGEFNEGAIPPLELAIVAQRAENIYFGKPSGLMDQVACAVGGIVTIDFEDPQNPIVSPVPFDLAKHGYRMVITDTGGSHADLTHEYAAIRSEMEAVAGQFGKKVLREVDYGDLLANIARLRNVLGDRAILRALHFFGECDRVEKLREAAQNEDMAAFLRIVRESGDSSFEYNQNAYCASAPREQGVPLALLRSQIALGDRGAWRLQGGGFAGTIQAFMPEDMLTSYRNALEGVFGDGACHVLQFREQGPVRIPLTDWEGL